MPVLQLTPGQVVDFGNSELRKMSVEEVPLVEAALTDMFGGSMIAYVRLIADSLDSGENTGLTFINSRLGRLIGTQSGVWEGGHRLYLKISDVENDPRPHYLGICCGDGTPRGKDRPTEFICLEEQKILVIVSYFWVQTKMYEVYFSVPDGLSGEELLNTILLTPETKAQ